MTLRLPAIARRVLSDNEFPEATNRRIEALAADLPEGRVRPLKDREAPDSAGWEGYIEPHLNRSWLDVPWFFAEAYFYRRLLEATGYYRALPGKRVDPFAGEKQRGLAQASPGLPTLLDRMGTASADSAARAAWLARLFGFILWGNQADLSLQPAGSTDGEYPGFAAVDQDSVLADDRPALVGFLMDTADRPVHLGWVADNAGFELAADLLGIDRLLTARLIDRATLIVKPHPTFVSDATPLDVGATVDALRESRDGECRFVGDRLLTWLEDGRLWRSEDFFWTSPLAGWEMPDTTRDFLGQLDLVIVKGDMNYRRLLGDLHWEYSTPFERIVGYFPTRLGAFRVLKAELAAGLEQARFREVERADPGWLTNGRWGTIQAYLPLS